MSRFVCCIALLLSVSPAPANESTFPNIQLAGDSRDKLCAETRKLAHSIWERRIGGTPLEAMMELTSDPYFRKMMTEAYMLYLPSDPDSRERTGKMYEDSMVLACYQAPPKA